VRKFSSAVVGLGKIGQGLDYEIADDSLVKTHATGLFYHDGFQLAAGVDPDKKQRDRFEKKFDHPAFPDIDTLRAECRPSVISIAVPTHLHFPVAVEVLSCEPRIVLCEKPFTETVEKAEKLRMLAREIHCSLAVNYGRRFDPSVLQLRDLIRNGKVGEIYKGSVWYTKGLFNNCSHFIDILIFLLGPANDIRIVSKGDNHIKGDPEPDFCITFDTVTIYFIAARSEHFSFCNFELVGTKGTIRYDNSGADIDIRCAGSHPFYEGYTILDSKSERMIGCLKRFQWHVFDNIYKHLTWQEKLNSGGDSATETLRVIESICDLLALKEQA